MTDLYHPLRSLRTGSWFKLICGASLQHLPAVRNLTLAYTLAGADCVDVAADPAVIQTAQEAIRAASNLIEEARMRSFGVQELPWLMVSLNDGEDPHFRKAEFNPALCPGDCPRPCEKICPAQAIAFNRDDGFSGVVNSRCYGCGRCLPVCPIQQISARSYVSTPAAIAPLVLQGVDAVEIHTQVGRLIDFDRLWQAIVPSLDRLKLISISCPDEDGLVDYLWALHKLISPLPCPVIWQTDGRPMSGDIGDGATRASVRLGQKVLAAGLPGYVQLAGGTNRHTVSKLKGLGLLSSQQVMGDRAAEDEHLSLRDITSSYGVLPVSGGILPQGKAAVLQPSDEVRSPRFISGVAYGSYARVLLSAILNDLEKTGADNNACSAPDPLPLTRLTDGCTNMTNMPTTLHPTRLEAVPDLLWQAVGLADSLVSQLKSPVAILNEP